MKPEEYWARRLEALNEAELKKGEDYIRKQNEEYDRALARIQKETETWYARLAKNNEVSLAEARKLLTNNELKEFKWTVDDYIKAGRENAVDQRWMKELENASAKVHISRLEELETKIRQEVEMLAARRVSGTTEVLGDIYKDGYYKGIYEVQRGVGEGMSFARLDDRQIDKVLSKPWAPDGRNFSARIWADRDKLLAELQTVLTQDLIRGENVDKVIADFAERMNVSKHAAARLILTESAYFSGQSRIEGYKQTGVKHYKYVATLDHRTSEQCREMDGQVIPISESKAGVNYPPLHAYCRSTTIPVFDDDGEDDGEEKGERAARDADGETYYVPAGTTYKEWAEEHAPPDATKPSKAAEPEPIVPTKVKPVEPPKLPTEPRPAKVREKDRQFASADEADDWIDESSSEWIKEITPEDIKTIRTYTGDDYEDLNLALRSANPPPETVEFAKTLKNAIDKFVLTEAIVTWRGVDNFFGTTNPIEIKGMIRDDFGFFSTSLLREKAFPDKDIMIEVHLPAGSHGAPIKYFSQYPDEYEYLLSPVVKYVILDAREENGKLHLVIEVIDDGEG